MHTGSHFVTHILLTDNDEWGDIIVAFRYIKVSKYSINIFCISFEKQQQWQQLMVLKFSSLSHGERKV